MATNDTSDEQGIQVGDRVRFKWSDGDSVSVEGVVNKLHDDGFASVIENEDTAAYDIHTSKLELISRASAPEPETPADLDWRAIAEWALSGDTGTSSETIVRRIVGVAPHGWSRSGYPHDLDDFGRCYRLLERIPSLRAHLPMLRAEGPVWSALVDAWDGISAAYAAQMALAREASQNLPLARWYFGHPVYDPATLAAARATDRLFVAALHAGNPTGERSVEQVEAAWAQYDEAEARKARGEPDPDDDDDSDADDDADGEWDDEDD